VTAAFLRIASKTVLNQSFPSRGKQFIAKFGGMTSPIVASRLGFADVFDDTRLVQTYADRRSLLTDIAN
jgi:hypothetical protein